MLSTAPVLRSAAASSRLQTSLFTSSAYQAPTPGPLCSTNTTFSPKRRVGLSRPDVASSSSSQTSRLASTTGSTSPTPSTSRPSTDILDWNTFFKLRKTRRWYQLGSSVGGGLGGMFAGAQVLLSSNVEAITSQFPIDPFFSLGLITASAGGLGWLMGPVLGTALFNARNKKVRGQMDEKAKEFYYRVKKYRVDPAGASASNPVPDYYGEKISSVAGYRQWRKDQRAFKKKREIFV